MKKLTTKHYGALVAGLILVLALTLMLTLFASQEKAPEQGQKTITVEVIVGEDSTTYTLTTNEEYLAGALLEANLVKGDDGQYGLYITEVTGVKADESKQEWWCITKNGEQMFTSVSGELIEDGNKYEITLFVGW